MTCEAKLTRKLGIRFIDARMLISDAKLSQGIDGYPHRDQEANLIQEAIRLYNGFPKETRKHLREKSYQLDGYKLSSTANSVDGLLKYSGALMGDETSSLYDENTTFHSMRSTNSSVTSSLDTPL